MFDGFFKCVSSYQPRGGARVDEESVDSHSFDRSECVERFVVVYVFELLVRFVLLVVVVVNVGVLGFRSR